MTAQKIYDTHEDYLKAKRKRNAEYNEANTIRMTLRLNNNTDADVIEKLKSVPSRTEYIKALIRADIEREEN